jgi:6-phosphogluconate dehydrogenase
MYNQKIMKNAQFGMIGLGTMGRNFLLNVAEKGFSGIGYNRHADKLQLLREEGEGFDVSGVDTIESFIAGLEVPRKIMLLVPAGSAVDSVIDDLLPHLEQGDLIIDGGNSHFSDTERREAFLKGKGIRFLGVGVSGGEEGARHGASIMIGGEAETYELVRPILEAASAKVGGEPCAAYLGKSSSGHFVKMVHNGIEYGLMQILAETYDFMNRILKMSYDEMSATFADWNNAELNSFLVEITAEVLKKRDADTGNPLVEMILDKAAQKGTGKWTSQVAMDFGVPIPTIDSAVSMRQISAQKETRVMIAEKYGNPASEVEKDFSENKQEFIELLKQTLLSSFIVTYAQGMSLLQAASEEKNYELNLVEIAKIWRGGCIIRSQLLEDMRRAYSKNPDLPNMILDDEFAEILSKNRDFWCKINNEFAISQVPSLCLSSALSYFDAFRSSRLPANLIQGQRDFFGAHTYQRIDKEGTFHTPDWNE